MTGATNPAAMLWEWHYLIFILPFAVGALLLVLSSLHFGGHGHHSFGHHTGGHAPGLGHAASAGHTHAAAHGGAGHSHAAPASSAHSAHVQTHGTGARHGGSSSKATSGVTPVTIAMLLFGIGRAPLPLVIEFFLICWGIAGFWAVENLVRSTHPNLFQMMPALAVALGSGVVGSRLAAEVVGRIMPRDETSVVSGDALYGLTGKVVYAVSETGGRVHVYDEFGTLHDESCRVAAGHPDLPKGSTVMITDREAASGRLIVEPCSALPRRDA